MIRLYHLATAIMLVGDKTTPDLGKSYSAASMSSLAFGWSRLARLDVRDDPACHRGSVGRLGGSTLSFSCSLGTGSWPGCFDHSDTGGKAGEKNYAWFLKTRARMSTSF